MKNTVCLVILTLLFMIFPPPTYAKKVVFEDDFSSELNKWELTRGGYSIWSVADGKLHAKVLTSFTISELVPTNQYWDDSWRNIEYQLEYTPIAGVDKNISFGYKNIDKWYEIHFVSSFFEVVKVENGALVWSKKSDYSLINNKTYTLNLVFQNGNIEVYVDSEQIFKDFDPNFTENDYGKIGLKVGTGAVYSTQVIFDNVVVYDLDQSPDSELMPHFMQTDESWGDSEYDSATKWSDQPTIARWGCALSSMAMILRNYQINTLPSGETIDPKTLNEWLKSQPDGYWGNGLLNWLAVTRLTKQLSTPEGTPALEYTKETGENLIDTALVSVEDKKPVILEIPGHFLVGDGMTADGLDLQIKDPAYSFSNFSQHQQPLKSVRLFHPSHTDLSHIAIGIPPQLTGQLVTPSGKIIQFDQIEYLNNYLGSNLLPDQSTSGLKIVELPKPELGEYQLWLSQEKFGQFQATIFTYDLDGNVSDLSVFGFTGQKPTLYQLDYSHSGEDSVTKISSYFQFKELVRELAQLKEISNPVMEIWLQFFADTNQECTSNNKAGCIKLLRQAIKSIEKDMTQTARKALEDELRAIKKTAK